MSTIDKALIEDARILKERPEIRSAVEAALKLGKVELNATIIFAEALQLGATPLDAARNTAVYLEEHGKKNLAESIMREYDCTI